MTEAKETPTPQPDPVFEPWGDRLLIRPCDLDFGEVSHIIRPDISEDSPEYGQILAVGPDCVRARAGMFVMFGRYSGYGAKDQEFLILREKEVLGQWEGVSEKRGERLPEPEQRRVLAAR